MIWVRLYCFVILFFINLRVNIMKFEVVLCIDLGKGVSCCLCNIGYFLVIVYGGEVVLVFILLNYDDVMN